MEQWRRGRGGGVASGAVLTGQEKLVFSVNPTQASDYENPLTRVCMSVCFV